MIHQTFRFPVSLVLSLMILASSCGKLVKWTPDPVTDTGEVEITCDATEGNKGLLDYNKDVYVHVGLITNKSVNRNDWEFVLFDWGSKDPRALATPAGKNKWKYKISNIREFFKVGNDEKILNLVILFRAGECYDTHCRALRNADESDIYIPITDNTVTLSDAPPITQ